MGTWVGNAPQAVTDEDGNLSPATGLEQLERKQKRTFVQIMQQGFNSNSQRRFEAADVAGGCQTVRSSSSRMPMLLTSTTTPGCTFAHTLANHAHAAAATGHETKRCVSDSSV